MRKILFLLFTFPVFLFARKGSVGDVGKGEIAPWFTGPLICPTPNIIQGGHYDIEPYLYATKTPAIYQNDWHTKNLPTQWTITTQLPTWIGLTDWCDIAFSPTLLWNHKDGGGGNWALGDFGLQVDFQIWNQGWKPNSLWPSVKVAIRQMIPVGKYRNLDPKKLSADLGGTGSWVSYLHLVLGQIIHISGYQFLSWRLAGEYTLYNSLVHVKGYNAYGGGMGTNGRVRPGANMTVDFSLEYSITRHWALAMDLIGSWQGKSNFDGYAGIDPVTKSHTIVATKASIQYSIAPAIEYNWNNNLGIIGGAWFTVAGKQISKFCTYVIAVNYYK